MRKYSTLTWLLFLSFFAYGFTVFAIGPCITSIRETYGVSREVLGIIFPAFSICFAICSIIGGFAAERFGGKSVLMAGLAVYGVSMIFFAMVPELSAHPIFALAVVAMAFNGGASGLIELNASAIGADANPDRKAQVLNVLQVAFGVGAISSPLLISALFAYRLSWQFIYYLGGALALIVLTLLAFEPTSHHRPQEPITRKGFVALAKSPCVWALTLAMIFYIGGEVSFADWQSDYLEKGLGAARAVASAVPSVFWLAMTLGRVAVSVWADRLVARKSIIVMGIGGSAAILAASHAESVHFAIVCVFIAGVFLAGGFGMLLTYATERFGLHTGPVFSFMIAGVGAGAASFPAVTGIVADRWSIGAGMLVPSALILAFGIVFVLINKLPDKAWEEYLAERGSA